MSVNNLSDQLNWLLSQAPFIPPEGFLPNAPKEATSVYNVQDDINAEVVGEDAQHVHGNGTGEGLSENTDDGVSQTGERPVTHRDNKVEQEERMVRLRAPPSPSRRPCSSLQQADVQTTKPSLDFHEQPKMQAPRHAFIEPPKMWHGPVVDLTEEEGKRDSKTASAIKKIDFAPTTKKKTASLAGSKRKSQEYEQDIHVSAQKAPTDPPLRTISIASASTRDSDDEPPPPYSIVPQRGFFSAPQEQIAPLPGTGRSDACPEAGKNEDDKYFSNTEDDTSLFVSPAAKPLQNLKVDETPQKIPCSPLRPQVCSPARSPRRNDRKPERTAISDSEDSDPDVEYQLSRAQAHLHRPHAPLIPRKHSPNHGTSTITKPGSSPRKTSPEDLSSQHNDRATPKTPASQSFSDFTIEDDLPLLHPLGDDPVLKTFCGLSVDNLNAYKRKLSDQHKRAKLQYVATMEEDEIDLKSKSAFDLAKAELGALQALMAARADLVRLMDTRSMTQNQIGDLLDGSSDPSEPELVELRRQLRALKLPIIEKESVMKSLIHQSGVASAQPHQRHPPDQGHSRVAVQATQAIHSYLQPLRRKEPQVPSTSEVIGQTQAPRFGAMSFSSPEKPFSTAVMGSPPSHFQPDSNGVDDDYGDFSEEDFMHLGVPAASPSKSFAAGAPITSRAALRQTSGNEMGPPPLPKKILKTKASKSGLVKLGDPGFDKPWSQEVIEALTKRFGLRGFRDNQLPAINATLDGKDVFVLMPTGGGKSLCYQLPAVVHGGSTNGVTIVISPLVSLMEDQVSHLEKLGIKAKFINTSVPWEERKIILDALRSHHPEVLVSLLYITPEMLQKSDTLMRTLETLNANSKFARLVIDEAHCVSQWGHDFRPDYKLIGEARARLRGVPVMALTATATPNVKTDVMANLQIEGCAVYTQSFNRENLHYEVRKKQKDVKLNDELVELIQKYHRRQTGIIYCLSRKSCEKLAEHLQKNGVNAHHYHAGVSAPEKTQIQRDWQAGKRHVIVATIAFGMGIDKPDVRFVIHHSMPKSVEGYYQETGRAGRDGKKSMCYLYYTFSDYKILKKMIDEGEGSSEQKERLNEMLKTMIRYCDNRSDCRRKQVLSYFGEHNFDERVCDGFCDNCNSNAAFEERDVTSLARKVASLVRQTARSGQGAKKGYTTPYMVELFNGHRGRKEEWQLNLPEFGAGSDMARGETERIFQRLIMDQVLEEFQVTNRSKFPITYLQPGPKSNLVNRNTFRMSLVVRVEGSSAQKPKRTTNVIDEEDEAYVASAPQPKRARTTSKAATAASTFVSSPLQGPTRNLERFNFEDDDDDDAFETAPVAKPTRKSRARRPSFGAPITIDEQMSGLSNFHRQLVEEFVKAGRKLCEQLRKNLNLKRHPFSETVLRQFAIEFPENLASIKEADPLAVQHHGHKFLDLLKPFARRYRDHMAQEYQHEQLPAGAPVQIRNHQNVVDLVDDDDDDLDPDEAYVPHETDILSSQQQQQHSKYFANNDMQEHVEIFDDDDFPDDFDDDEEPRRTSKRSSNGKGRDAPARKRRSGSAVSASRGKAPSYSKGTSKKTGRTGSFARKRSSNGEGPSRKRKSPSTQSKISKGGGLMGISAMPI